MKILCIGDVVGPAGRDEIKRRLPALRREYGADIVIVNGENSADGNGVSLESAGELFTYGADVITTGNHVFRRDEIYDELDRNPFLLRPANYPDSAPGNGYALLDTGRTRVAVINLMGVVYMDALASPFDTLDRLIDRAKEDDARIITVDFHAESTAEKKALAYYADGRISALFGTHTHTQTADEQILPKGTGFITDLGMTGPYDSVLGVKPEQSIRLIKDKMPVRFSYPDGRICIQGCLIETDDKSGACTGIKRISVVDNNNK